MITDTIEDICKKYQHSYVLLFLEGKNYLVEFTDYRDKRFIFFSPKYGEILLEENDVRNLLSVWFPKQGLYNIDNVAMEFARVPERQWKRGPCPNNISVNPILSSVGLHEGVDPPEISVQLLEKVRSSNYPKSLKEALQTINISKALSLDFAITESPKPSEASHCLWYKSTPIGIINKTKQEITIKYKALFQETLDYFRKKEPEWQVTQ